MPIYSSPGSSVGRLLNTNLYVPPKPKVPVAVAPTPIPRPAPVAAPVAVPTPVPAPVVPAPGSAASIAPREAFSYARTADDLAADAARARVLAINGADANMAINPEKEYRSKLKMYQAQINATNAVYNDRLNASRVAGQGRLGSSRAMQGRSGLLGSDFGAAQTDNITAANQEADQAIQNERSVAIASIMNLARKDAQESATAKAAAKRAGADALLKYYSEDVPAQRTGRVSKVAKALFDRNTDPSTLTPAELKQLTTEWNISADDFKSAYTDLKTTSADAAAKKDLETRKSEADISKINAEIAEGKWQSIGEGTMLRNLETGETIKNPKTYAPTAGGGSAGGGIYSQLDYRTANAVIAQGNKFAESPIVKTYNNLVSAANLISGVDSKSKNPADHQAIIYNFAKALDPDSVVREGEYETIKKYSQGLATKYKGELNQAVNGTGFLSEQAIQDIQKATANRVASYSPQYQNIRTQSAARINSIAGQDVADTVLLDFESGYQAPDDLSGGVVEVAPNGDQVIIVD